MRTFVEIWGLVALSTDRHSYIKMLQYPRTAASTGRNAALEVVGERPVRAVPSGDHGQHAGYAAGDLKAAASLTCLFLLSSKVG
ncbi:MAG: hypothetical protein ABJO27_15715 [Pseudoruegeria sp.]